MKPSQTRCALLWLAGTVAAIGVGACILNPQPLPPSASAEPGSGSSSGDYPTVPDSGAISKGDAALQSPDADVLDGAAMDASFDANSDAGGSDAGDAGD